VAVWPQRKRACRHAFQESNEDGRRRKT